MTKKFISICIPAYNRPNEIKNLLESIDYKKNEELEVIICEDNSPKRKKIRQVVENFKLNSKYKINYIENEKNKGYDKNIRDLIEYATGEYVIFMGDDDRFVPGGLDKYSDFLKKNNRLGYVLKTSRTIKRNKSIEEFRYYSNTKFFEKGFESYVTLFRKSVFISGFTIKRETASKFFTDKFDGTLLYQLYILAEVTLQYESAYCDILLTEQDEGGIPMFGSSESEKDLYTPGIRTIEGEINFISGYYKITNYLDKKYNFNSTSYVKKDMSKYSYPILALMREQGIKKMLQFHKELKKIGINCTIYYYFYLIVLIIFDRNICNKVITRIKNIVGYTPRL